MKEDLTVPLRLYERAASMAAPQQVHLPGFSGCRKSGAGYSGEKYFSSAIPDCESALISRLSAARLSFCL